MRNWTKNKWEWYYIAIENVTKRGYTKHFLFNFLVFAIVYKLFGLEWLLVIAIADITRDLGMMLIKMYEN